VSPEGAGGKRVDARADLYATALVLYRMLAGRGPFDHFRSQSSLLAAHRHEDPEPPSRFAPGPIPHELDLAVLKALRKDPAARFQSAAEFGQELGRIAELVASRAEQVEDRTRAAIQPRPDPHSTRESRFARPRISRAALLVVSLAVAALAAVAGAGLATAIRSLFEGP
jgi:serine/threonine-protein kinase